ncbi:MAG TPA: hypothetical protein DCY32_01920 [Opitutae bacterium]|nr:hypothetical protein [Opitutae bacterium]
MAFLLAFHAIYLKAKPLVMWISSFQDQVYYEKMVELYAKKSGKSFDLEIKAYGFREMPDKLGVAFRTGQGIPDLVQLDETFFGVFLNGPSPFLDLSERARKSGLSKTLHPRRLEVFTYKNELLGLPQSLSAMMMYYRKDLFEDFGIEPADLSTWGELAEVGARLMDNHSQRLLALDGTLFDVLLRQKGSDLFDRKGKFLPDQKVALEVLTEFAEMSQAQIAVMPDRGSIFDPVFFSGDLENGEVLCVAGADWYGLDLFQQFAPAMQGAWGMMPLPTWRKKNGELGPRTATFAGQGLMICKASKSQDEAWDFIEFVMKDKGANAERFLQGNSFPAYLPSWKDRRLLDEHEYFEQSMGKLLVELADEIPPVVVDPRRPQAIFLMQENYFGSVMFGSLSPREALSQYREAMKTGWGESR